MHIRWKEVIAAIILGAIVPAILFKAVERNEQKKENIISETTTVTQTTPTEDQTVWIPVMMTDGNVEEMELDEYLVGVVLKEMPTNFELEALKSQAVVARTYTLRRVRIGGKHQQAAVCTDSSCCQGFYSQEEYLAEGGDEDALNRVQQAVAQTRDTVLVYQGQLIDATYFSCSGGNTEDAQAVWGADVPYLQSVESPGEEGATHYTDTVTIEKDVFLQKLGLDASSARGDFIKNITHTRGAGVDTLDICGSRFTGSQMRKLLGLRSTSFTIATVGERVIITTKGFGHRVGMSQYGADAMAVQGKTYDEILRHYYSNTELVAYSSLSSR